MRFIARLRLQSDARRRTIRPNAFIRPEPPVGDATAATRSPVVTDRLSQPSTQRASGES